MVSVAGGLMIMDSVCVVFETLPYANLTVITYFRLGILAFGIIAAAWFVWRGIEGFRGKMDFLFDDD
jgi:hypothetical protein